MKKAISPEQNLAYLNEEQFFFRSNRVIDTFVSYTGSVDEVEPYLTVEQVQKLTSYDEVVQRGFLDNFKYIVARFIVAEAFPEIEERQQFERNLRSEMASLDRTDKTEFEYWQQLHLLHQCSVTADQAELSRAVFL